MTLRSIGDAVITTDATGLVEYLNPVAEQLTGWRSADAAGQTVEAVFHVINQHTRLPAKNLINHCLATRAIVDTLRDAVLISKDGSEYAVEDSAAPIFSSIGAMIGVVMVFRDVTDQRKKQMEVAHRASNDYLTGLPNRAKFDRVLKQLFESALTTNAKHALCYINLDHFKILTSSPP